MLLLTLVKQARQGSEVQVDVIQRDGTSRTYRRENALVEAEVRTPLFTVGGYADPIDELPDNSRVIGELCFLTEKRILSFFCQYMSTRELARAVKATKALDELGAAYGYVCDAGKIVGPNYYALGMRLFSFDDPMSEILDDQLPMEKWRTLIDSLEKPHVHGKLRDLYPENVLTRDHLREFRTHGLLDDPMSGISIDNLGSHLFWMTVSPEALVRTRARLVQKGLILAPGSY